MTTRGRQRATPLVLAALAFALALLQRPGWSSSDTKIDLHTDPLRFLGEAASLWTPGSGLGGVESAQYAGYLFPMGPFFALGHLLGLPDWLVDRVWLGLLLAVGCWGICRLVRALGAAGSPVGEATAGLIYLLNPYVVVFANRTSGFLLAYALLPWMILAAWRGLRDARRWRQPAIFALLVTSSLGGVNAAVIGLVLLAPLALIVYEPATGAVGWRDARSFGWRALAATVAASLWWIAPAAAQSVYGNDFLRFTEPAGAIWATTSLSESFRAMGYWISYIGVGFDGVVKPYFSDSGVMLWGDAVVWATFLVPGVALLGFAWTRTRRYAPYFLLLVLLGTLVMTVGFPEGTPLRRGATFAYNHFASTRFLRTTYKAGPLVVLGVAALGAMLAELIAERHSRRWVGAALAVAAVAVVALSAWPLVRGDAVDRQVSWKRIPAAWRDAAHELNRSLGDDRRAVVLPGQLYAFYRWGGTVDPILPALTKKPVAVRVNAPYEDLRGADLLWTTDALVQQDRVLPGQLLPLLRLMGAGRVVTATDDDVFRSGSARPAVAAAALAGQGLGRPAAYGPQRRFAQAPDAVGPPVVLPEVRTYAVGGARPLVRVEPRGPLGVVDGSAEGLADLAGFGALPARAPFAYAADLAPAAIAAAARQSGTVVITDSNRRRIQVVSRISQNSGATLGATDPISQDAATLNPFASRGAAGQTVAVLHGARWIRAPFSPGYPQFPEHRPFAAFDGDPRTAWLADRALQGPRHWVEVGFTRPRDVPFVDVLPRAEAGAIATAVDIGGRRYPLRRGWTRLRLGLEHVPSLRIRVVTGGGGSAAAAGLAEVRVPGLHVSESLRPPLLAEQALRGTDLSHTTLTYAFSRATGDAPWRRSRSAGLPVPQRVTSANRLEQLHVDSAGDEETGIDRVIAPPAARAWSARAWVSALPEALDSALDRLAGYRGPVVADSSAHFQGIPGFRASSAFDGDPATAWAAPWRPGLRPWLRVTRPKPFVVRELGLTPPPQGIAAPAAVQVAWDGGHSGRLPVAAGRVVLPAAAPTRTLKLTVVRSRFPRAAAVGIAELRIPGLAPMSIPRTGPLAAGCGAVTVATAGGALRLRPQGDVKTLDAGLPMRATSCDVPVQLPAGNQRLRAPAGTLRLDRLLLTSPAPRPVARSAVAPGTVTDPGSPGNGTRDHVRLSVRAPAWLVLGESYDRGWRATCNGKALGTPVPLDGYANAWPVAPGCHTASFEFAPQKPVRVVQILSALACLLLLAVALRGRRGAREAEPAAPAALPDRPPAPVRARRAVVAGLVAGAALGFCFSLRSGLAIAPAIAIVLWLGIAAEPLALAGGLLLAVVVPLVYIAFPASDQGGFNPSYPLHHIGAHWVAVGAWVLLALALWRALSTARADGRRAP